MIPAIPFAYLAVTATVAYTIKRVADIVEEIVGRPTRAAELEHELKMTELKMTELKGKQALSAVAQEAFDALSDLRKLRESMEIERAKMQAMAKPGSNPRAFKSN